MSADLLGGVNRPLVRVVAVAALVVGLAVATFTLPEPTRDLWFGTPVEHCPGSEFSCPSHQPGLSMIPMAVFVLLLVSGVIEEPDDG